MDDRAMWTSENRTEWETSSVLARFDKTLFDFIIPSASFRRRNIESLMSPNTFASTDKFAVEKKA